MTKEYAGKGLSRQLLSHALQKFDTAKFSILLHTHPVSYAAIKLYSDFGFSFVTDSKVRSRENHLEESKELLIRELDEKNYNDISTTYLLENIKVKIFKLKSLPSILREGSSSSMNIYHGHYK